MAVRLSSWLVRPGLLGTFFAELRLAWRLIREPRVPVFVKAIPVLAILYVVSPLDVVPDVVPVLGQIDDLGVLVLSLKMFLRMCPAGATAFHAAAISKGRRFTPMAPTDVVIDATYWRE